MNIARYARTVWAMAVLLSGFVAFTGSWVAYADEGERREGEGYRDDRNNHERREGRRDEGAAGFPDNATYRQECSSCHVLFHPGLLPARSWEKVLNNSSKHFGENLSLDDKTAAELKAYFDANSAEHSGAEFSRKILRDLGKATPERITESPYMKREHRKINKSVFARPSIKSPSNCGACHPGAAQGDFNEDNVSIPK